MKYCLELNSNSIELCIEIKGQLESLSKNVYAEAITRSKINSMLLIFNITPRKYNFVQTIRWQTKQMIDTYIYKSTLQICYTGNSTSIHYRNNLSLYGWKTLRWQLLLIKHKHWPSSCRLYIAIIVPFNNEVCLACETTDENAHAHSYTGVVTRILVLIPNQHTLK